MSDRFLSLQDHYSDLTVLAPSGDNHVELTIEFGAQKLSFATSRSDTMKLRDFLNDFLSECDEIERLKGCKNGKEAGDSLSS